MVTVFDMRHDNDVNGLCWIHLFGWLRSAELGRLLWPGDKYGRTRADRVIRGWLARGLVIERQLPNGARRAVVVSEAGARLLQAAGFEDARTGKDWGETEGAHWRPNQSWQHDLLAAGVLVRLHEDGYEIQPEKALRRQNPGLTKIPDGLAWKGEQVVWLEVEQARKTGKAMAELADALCAVAGRICQPVSGRRPTLPMVAFVTAANDERGMTLDHQLRVRNAVKKAANQGLRLVWAACELAGCGVATVIFEPEDIESDRAAKILKVLDAGGWKEDDRGCVVGHYDGFKASVWCDDDMGWCYLMEGPGMPECAQQADNKTAAMRGCANLLAKL